jgi:hypothetical protein
MMPPATAPRLSMAMPNALVARSTCWRESMAQAATRREYASMTTQQ